MSEKAFTHITDQELLSQYYKSNDNRLLGVLLQRYPVQYFKSWLYMIARNYCLMQLRKHDVKSVKEINENIIEETYPLQDAADKEKLLTLVESSLDELNADQKTCITLFYLDKRSYQQISEQTGLSLMQVKSFIQNGKRNLKILVEKKLHHKSWKI